ncbi:hypothetical protein THRCLA_00741 [Thraustotheca clavata]|uniref:Protein phosphatase n=1 Tax=Thraustotheca clavata TaxID=74557 RepID=A0A1W0AAP9_9STRA|nr:hypothetical protein THRCLA_00741 [Thraustotheca clavata]
MPVTRLSNLLERLSSKLSLPEEDDEWLPTTPTSTLMDDSMPIIEHGANMTTRKRRKPLLHRFFNRRTPLEVSYGSANYDYHGEDAMAITSYYQIIADGVSAGNQNHVSQSPSALLARTLVNAIEKTLIQYEALVSQVPTAPSMASFQERILHTITSVQSNLTFEASMASTLVVCYIDRRSKTLYTFCIGDSKASVVRKEKVIYETFAVLKEFNVPAVINEKTVSRFMVQTIQLQPGDRLVSFSDGIGDNLFKDQLVSMLVSSCRKTTSLSSAKSKIFAQSQELPSSICYNIAHIALDNESNDWKDYPFSVAAAKEYISRIQRNGGTSIEKTKANELKHALKDTKAIFDRSVSACNPNGYTNHYLITQVERMANLTHKKPDDISICLSVFA